MTAITNPAPNPMPTQSIRTDSGDITVPCEPINDWLAITPVFGMDAGGKGVLLGVFTITHRPTGMNLGDGGGCIRCCRRSGAELAKLDADWSALTAANSAEWSRALSAETRGTLATSRSLDWICDADYCGSDDDNRNGAIR